jgi:DNA mismatch repair protein MutS
MNRTELPPASSAQPSPERLTPMFVQWKEAKRQHPGTILFFRMGDFYELFFEDAQTAAPILELALTARGKGTATEAPMCGVPHFAGEGYIAKLVERGFRVAICEQVEDPKKTKGMVRREVVRVVSPGVFTDAERMHPSESITLAAVNGRGPFGVCFADLSTGALSLARARDARDLSDVLARHETRELLVAQSRAADAAAWVTSGGRPILITPLADDCFHPLHAADRVLEMLGARSLGSFGCPEDHLALPATAAALAHLRDTQKTAPKHLDRLTVENPSESLLLDAGTRRNLEVVANMRDGSRQHTLLESLDATVTALGARALRNWLLEPLATPVAINARLDAVDALRRDPERRRTMREALGEVRDIERLLSRAALGSATPRDVSGLLGSLRALPAVKHALDGAGSVRTGELSAGLDTLDDLAIDLSAALFDEPGVQPGDGRVIRDGFDAALDESRDLARGGKRVLAEIEARERDRSGIATLKIKYNKVFGYYLEVSKSQLDKVPSDYERRQTVVGGERFVTPELRELETRILSAEEQMSERELELFSTLLRSITTRASRLRGTAAAVAEADVLACFAETAARENYCRPDVDEADRIELIEARHPVIERLLPAGAFVPNPCRLDESARIVIVTGPNMGGKSTYLRQVALLTLMAQAGSFVPARAAKIGIVDRIFCRVGASDNLAGGESTFMVEMTETANILHNATPKSLVILDEIGRGTATWDGMAIAWAVVEHLHEDSRLAPKALFATHYHELTELEGTLPRVANAHIAVREHGHDIVLLHRIEPGPSDRSYGIHVARLAGLPDRVVARAREILARLVSQHTPASLASHPPAPLQLALFGDGGPSSAEQSALQRLREIDPNALTPREALSLLFELSDTLREH